MQALRRTRDAAPTPFVAQLIGASDERWPPRRWSAPRAGRRLRMSTAMRRNGIPGPSCSRRWCPDVEPGTELRILKRAEEDGRAETIWTRSAPSRRPRVARFAVTIARGSGRATWEASGARECSLEFSLQFSKDAGRSWNGLAVGITTTRHRFPLTHLPSGRLIFRLLAHDGFHSVSAVSRPVGSPRRPPIVSILSPQEGRPYFAGSPLPYWRLVGRYRAALAEQPGDPARGRTDESRCSTDVDHVADPPEPAPSGYSRACV